MSHDPVVIVSAARTPMGSFQGAFAELSGPQLGARAIEAAVARARIDPGLVEQALMGCVLQAGLGQAPARQAVLQAGLPSSVTCATIHKVCGSAMMAVMLGHDSIVAGTSSVVVAGGMESMSNAPYLLPKARAGYRLGHDRLLDHMFLDGLEDAYSEQDRGRLMGCFAEECAERYQFSRQAQDAYTIGSTLSAKAASLDGSFGWEIVPVTVEGRKGTRTVENDEGPFAVNLERVPTLKPAFKPGGTVTAANSSSISDGAAALVLTRATTAEKLGLSPIARIIGHAGYAGTPARFPSAPVGAMKQLFQKTGLSVGDIDLFEINEAFAVVPMAAAFDLGLDLDRVNIHGGACALGHPIGASGARILVTLLGALKKSGGKTGVASLCIGGGEATALAVEML